MPSPTASSILLLASVALFLNAVPADATTLISSSFTSVGLAGVRDIDVTGPDVVDWGYYSVRASFLTNPALDNSKSGSGIGAVTIVPGAVSDATFNWSTSLPKFTMTFDAGGSPATGTVGIGAGLGGWAATEDNAATFTFNDLGVGTHTVRVFVGHSSNDRVFDMDYSVVASDGNLSGNTVSNSISSGDLHSTYEIVLSTTDPSADLTLRFNSTSGGTGSGWIGGYVVETESTTPPSITRLDPDGASGVHPGTALVATFSKDIALTGGGSIILDDTSGAGDIVLNVTDPAVVSVSGNTLTLTPPAPLAFGTAYDVVIASGTIKDTLPDPNGFPGTAPGQWTFTTAVQNPTPPVITGKSPADGTTGVSRVTAIVATFDQDILAGTGDIVIKDLDGGATTRAISVLDTSQVSLSGNVLTITPTAGLAAGTGYAVQIAGTAIRNYSGVAFPGIPATDDSAWDFHTREPGPNIIFILGDDQAWYDYSFMRRPEVEQAAIAMNPSIYQIARTPAIDRLADEGLVFTRGYSMPVCRPSLASMVTGAYPHQTLITGNDLAGGTPDLAVEARMQVMNPLPRTLATQLGYTSFQTGKWWEGHHSNGGFTAGDTVNSTATATAPPQWSAARPGYVAARHGDWGLMTGRVDYVNDVAAPADPIPYRNTVETVTAFIDAQVAADQPFFVWYAPFLPHTPHDPPAGLLGKYDALINEPNETGDYFAKYYANIERFDGGVGAILDHLDAQGIAGHTIVVLVCDNGWINQPNASAYAARSKQSPYEGGVRTPIIVRWPDRIKPGGALEPQVIATPVSIVDLVPTVHDAVGLPTFPEMRGLSLLDLSAVAARTTVFTEDSTHDIQNLNDPTQSLEARVAIRDGWKLILSANGNKELYHLYDSATGAPVDPHETQNLSASNPALTSELTTAIVNWYAIGANDFASWVSDPAFGLGAGDLGLTADPDGDSLPSGVEAWFGTHPGEFSPGLAGLVTDGTTITFSHPRNDNPPGDLTGFYQWSPNLSDWYAGDGTDGPGGGLTVTISATSAGPATAVAATASQAGARLFLRAGVTKKPE